MRISATHNYKRALLIGSFAAALIMPVFAAAADVVAAAPAGTADAYPQKPVRFIVPYPPGGPLDNMARMLAEKVRGDLGQAVIVENKAGAGGNIGADMVARSAPDGYTLVMGAVATHAINPWLFANLPYDPVKDFAPVTLVAAVPNVLVINREFAAKNAISSLADLVSYAKAHPGQLNYGSGGNGSAGHLSGELLKARAGINAEHIPYQGAAPAQLALLSGQSDFMFDNLAAAAPLIKAGSVSALAVTTSKRSTLLPDVPTVQEAGVSGFDLETWFGVFAPAGTPQPVLDKLYVAYSRAMALPDVRERLLSMGSEAQPMTPAAFAAFAADEMMKYKDVVKISGASLN